MQNVSVILAADINMNLHGYNIQGSQDEARLLARNNLRLISLRWYYIAFLVGYATLILVMASDSNRQVIAYGAMLLVTYLINAILLFIVKKFETNLVTQRIVIGAQLSLDLAVCSVVTYVQGGVESRTTALYAIPIIASGLTFSSRLIVPVAMMSGAAYSLTILLHAWLSDGSVDWVTHAVPVVFYPILFLVLGRITQFLSDIETVGIREQAYNSFLSLLAHQLKHPASATKTIVDAIVHDKTATHTEQTLDHLEMLKGENENQIRLIDNLLEAAPRTRIEEHSEEVNVTRLFEQVAHKVAVSHQRLSDLVKDESASKPVKVGGNEIKLRLALTNIFDNSFRHTPEGSLVHYGIRCESGVVTLTIRDEGVGMSREHLTNILERFNVESLNGLGSRHVGGLGLGLFVARQVFSAHDGEIEVKSKEGQGTVVTVRMKGAR